MTIKIHLIVLIHGLWGSNADLGYMKSTLKKTLPNDIEEETLSSILKNVNIIGELNLDSEKQYTYVRDFHQNNNFKTYDGIEMCGKRTQLELYSVLSRFENLESSIIVNKISFISYSLGGLISRYCLGLLYNDKFFDYGENREQKYEFANFVTVVSPHVGVISKNSKVSKLIGHSGVQLYLKDKDKLIYQMSLPNSSFVCGLKNFKNLMLYSNCINDLKTNFFTTGISHFDPFNQLYNEKTEDVKWLKFVSKYEGLIIDYDSSHLNVECNKEEEKEQCCNSEMEDIKSQDKNFDFEEELSKELNVDVELTIQTDNKTINKVVAFYDKFLSILLLFLFLVFRSPYEIFLSYYRRSQMIKLYKEDFKLINHIKINLNDDNASDSEDTDDSEDTESTPMFLATAKSNEEIIAESFNLPEKTPFSIAKRTINSILKNDNQPSLYLKELIDLGYEDLFHLKRTFFNFELVNPCDFELQHQIIHNMNQDILWKRYPVIIRKSKCSHAAIIVRYNKPRENFEEGFKIMNHLANNIVT